MEHLNSLISAFAENLAKQKRTLEADQPDKARIQNANDAIQAQQELLIELQKRETIREQHRAVAGLRVELETSRSVAEQIGEAVEKVGSRFQRQLIQEAELPVEGLQYEGGQFYWDGTALDNLSSSKALRLAVQVARKLACKTKLICIDGAELLDDESYSALRAEIGEDGYTYFITKVGEAFVQNTNDQVITMKAGVAV